MSELLLEIVEGAGAGERLTLSDSIELGRDPSLPHPLDDSKVSRHHARVTRVGGTAQVEDLRSTNGTFLNESPLEIATSISPGDRIRVGLTVLELRREEDRGTVAAPIPDLTQISADVLEPVPTRDLVDVPPPVPEPPAVRTASSEPHYVNTVVSQRIEELSPRSAPRTPAPPAPGAPPAPPARRELAGSDDAEYQAVARLVDARVKSRTNVAAFALLSIAALAVIIYFGAR